jgi:hypothetical protein
MDAGNVTYEQLPKPIPRERYEQARTELVEAYRGLNGVTAIYDTGTVTDPGISDLDIKVVYDPDEHPETPAEGTYSDIVDTLVGRGNIIKTPSTAFGQFHFLDPKRDPNHLSGTEIQFERPPETDLQFREAAYVLDYIPERLFQILQIQRQESLAVMRTLQMLKSVGYSCLIMEELLDVFEGQSFFEEVTTLRGGWFEREEEANFERMHKLVDEAADRLDEAARQWFDRSPTPIIEAERHSEGAISLFDELVYVSGEEFDYEEGTEFDVRMTIPSWWFDHYRFYAARESTLGRWLRTSYVGPEVPVGCLTPEYERYLDTKVSICNEAFSWSVDHGMDSALKFGFLLSRAGWNDEAIRQLKSRVDAERRR